MICMGIFLECSLSACKTSQNPGAWLTGVFFCPYSGAQWEKVVESGKIPIKPQKNRASARLPTTANKTRRSPPGQMYDHGPCQKSGKVG